MTFSTTGLIQLGRHKRLLARKLLGLGLQCRHSADSYTMFEGHAMQAKARAYASWEEKEEQ